MHACRARKTECVGRRTRDKLIDTHTTTDQATHRDTTRTKTPIVKQQGSQVEDRAHTVMTRHT